MLGPRLLSLHNVYLLDELMSQAREAIASGSWDRFKNRYLKQADAV
jgi:tRNA-guanine family transglycosylase